MNLIKYFLIFSIPAIAVLSACSEKDEFAPYLEGNIIGYAYCANEYGNLLDDFSGIRVVTEPGRKYSALTDKDGRFALKNVINGTYNLSFEKEGFGTRKIYGIQHLGGNPTILSYHYNSVYAVIYESITTQITAIYYQNDTLMANLSFSGSYNPGIIYMRLCFSTIENFDVQSAQASKSIELWKRGANYESYYGDVSDGLPFASGQSIYCKAFIYTENSNYYDFDKQTIVFPNISDETAEFFFTMP